MLNKRQALLLIVGLTIFIELVTALFRFGFQLESTKHTASTVGMLTGGIRIHHGYVGVVMCLASAFFKGDRRFYSQVLWIIGSSLVLSDLIHHFLVLWPITGSPQFDLVYPKTP